MRPIAVLLTQVFLLDYMCMLLHDCINDLCNTMLVHTAVRGQSEPQRAPSRYAYRIGGPDNAVRATQVVCHELVPEPVLRQPAHPRAQGTVEYLVHRVDEDIIVALANVLHDLVACCVP